MNHTIKEQFTELLVAAHQASAIRESSSTCALLLAWKSNGKDLYKSITCAIMTLGGLHAPIKHVFTMLDRILAKNQKIEDLKYGIVPGFGSCFVKGEHDPILMNLRKFVKANFFESYDEMLIIQAYLRDRKGIYLYPNIAFYTALHAHLTDVKYEFCESIVIESRLPVWIDLLEGDES